MKNGLLTLIFLLLAPIAFGQTKTGGPIIIFENDRLDNGTIANGAECKYTYPFTNTGNEPLLIKDATTQCGCAVSTYPKEPIEPGEKGIITLQYDSRRTGKITKNFTVTSNAVNTPQKALFYSVNVLAPIAIEDKKPDVVKIVNGAAITFETDFFAVGRVANGADCRLKYEFTNTGNEPLIISEVQSSCGCVVATWNKEPVLPGKKATITVMYDTKRTGPSSKSVWVCSNAINTPRKQLSFTIEVLPPKDTTILIAPEAGPRN